VTPVTAPGDTNLSDHCWLGFEGHRSEVKVN